jgi:ankyrin repeat domain-containing protein 50
MDGISSVASVISLLQVIGQVTTAVYRYTSSVRDAEACRLRLLAELHATAGIMNSVKTRLLDVSQDAPGVDERVENLTPLISPEGPLVHLETSLNIFLNELTKDFDEKRKLGISKKLAWPHKEQKINDVISNLERYKSLLSLALSTDILWVTS